MNLSTQNKEQKLLATIISCKKVLNNDHANDVLLFESVTGLYGGITPEIIAENNEVLFEDFQKLGDNKYAYIKKVKDFVYGEENSETIKPLNEDFIFDDFKLELERLMLDFEANNDFNVLDYLDKEVINTKLFTKKPINVLGFNIMESIKNLENKSLLDVFSILYNKSKKQIYFVRAGEILLYDIRTNEFKTIENKKLTSANYMKLISTEISSNVIEIYSNILIMKNDLGIKFSDNLFSDVKRTKELYDYKQETSFLK